MDQKGDTSSQGNYPYALLRNQEGQSELMLQPSAPTETGYYQQVQPSSQTGAQYYTQPYPAPRKGLAKPRPPTVVTRPVMRAPDTSIRLPKYAFVTSVVVTLIFTVLCWLPGFFCLVPAVVFSMVAITKKEGNKLKEAKWYSIISFVLVLIFAISYPILVTMLVIASAFGYLCDMPKDNEGGADSTPTRPNICL